MEANEDRHLRILHLRNRFMQRLALDVSSGHTVRRRLLRQHGIRAYRPFRGMTLTRQRRLRRLRWARQFQRQQHRNCCFLMLAVYSYSELMAGLGYADV